MSYRCGNRDQISFLPASIEEYVGTDDPVRAYDAFIDAINITELGIVYDEALVGNSAYDPSAMLKLLVYGYSYGIRSSRKLERAVHHNLSFIWLIGGLKPDHKTISKFRRENQEALKKLLKECARVCLKLGLIEGNTLFVDGTKLRANASLANTWTVERCEQALKKIDKRIELILKECEDTDRSEEKQPSQVHLQEKLADNKKLREKVTGILNELKESGKSSFNTVDPDSIRTRSSRGAHAGYNAQIVVDEKNGLIVNSEISQKPNDVELFAEQMDAAIDCLGVSPQNAVLMQDIIILKN